jgi:protein-disulfide isomerase
VCGGNPFPRPGLKPPDLAFYATKEHADLMRARLAGAVGFVWVFTLAAPSARAVPPSSPDAPAARAAGRSAKQSRLVDEVLATYHPYQCCSDTLAACLARKPVCPTVTRLERAITRMAGAGRSKSAILAALAHREATMRSEQTRAKIALDDRFRAGDAGAKVALVIYACPRNEACAKLIPDLHRAVTAGRLKGKVVLYYRPFFPAGNAEAMECGRGLYAAAYQGQFWAYLLHLCMEREHLKTTTLRDWVGRHGLDRCIFDNTCEQPGTAAWLAAAREEGVANGVTAAPAAFVNGRRIQGQLDLDTIVDVLEEEHERLAQPAPVKSPGRDHAKPQTAPIRDRRPASRP